MRRHWSQRLFTAIVTVWFGLVGLEPAFDACPMHDAVAIAGHDEHARHVGHTMAMPSSAATKDVVQKGSGGTPVQHESHQCTCPGRCCGPSAVTTPTHAPVLSLVAYVEMVQRTPDAQYRAAWTDFVLPFATAPPQHVSA